MYSLFLDQLKNSAILTGQRQGEKQELRENSFNHSRLSYHIHSKNQQKISAIASRTTNSVFQANDKFRNFRSKLISNQSNRTRNQTQNDWNIIQPKIIAFRKQQQSQQYAYLLGQDYLKLMKQKAKLNQFLMKKGFNRQKDHDAFSTNSQDEHSKFDFFSNDVVEDVRQKHSKIYQIALEQSVQSQITKDREQNLWSKCEERMKTKKIAEKTNQSGYEGQTEQGFKSICL